MTLAPARRPTRDPDLAAGQLVEFHRPSPRGGRGLCRGLVIKAQPGSVVVRCTESTVIGFHVGAQLRLSTREVTVMAQRPPSIPLTLSMAASLREKVDPGAAGGSGTRDAPAVSAPAGVDVTEVLTDPVERSAARPAFAATQQLEAPAGVTA